ncbi:mediator of RNA polymerase II transcription subunit 21 family protein [Nitzschia inconspicua]|uniref:Mediator of RNA polymerase II transcription subunit 21 n=1 Tax=Nitzschia inconspicua TaxID=303405 RepID=A0A9K3PF96_9STRA|nr:mediator of RNA polymerase II transcription subunit 21 family protein [Nitzschia inconspicua]
MAEGSSSRGIKDQSRVVPPAAVIGISSGSAALNHVKIDQISALQDGIDSLSLAMFEALRGLRDAVAPESGNLGGGAGSANNNNSDTTGDFEEFWQSYKNGDAETVALVKKLSPTPPSKREDYIRIHAKVEMEKDAELVARLASTVLQKSANIDDCVSQLPGMHRTRTQQMEYIRTLLEQNQKVAQILEDKYRIASERRDQVRQYVKDRTCEALGIIDD